MPDIVVGGLPVVVVSVATGTPVISTVVSGGIGPGAYVDATTKLAIGVNPVSGGTNITISTTGGTYSISGSSDYYISSKAPVQSVAGRTGAVTIVAGDIASGVFDVARIPVLPSQSQSISTGAISSVTLLQQADIGKGGIVTTVDGRRWVYSGAGAKTTEASYVELADITPEWSVIANKPSTFSPSTHTHSTADITGNVVYSVQGRTGTVVLSAIDITAASSTHTHASAFPSQGGLGGYSLATDGTSPLWVSRFSVLDPVLVAGSNVSLTRNTSAGTIVVASSGSGGSGTMSNSAARALGTASSGTSSDSSRDDHVHPMPVFVGGSNVGVVVTGNTVTISATGGTAGITLWPSIIFGG